jgi:hypothetical protein
MNPDQAGAYNQVARRRVAPVVGVSNMFSRPTLGGCMSATPHNGKEADFQLFMGLLDADRFEGRFREGVHKADVSDMMRRLTKEELYRFDGSKLFPERLAYTASYELSPFEADLYQAVTTYVREEMNRADRNADGARRNNVGFALQIL